MPAAVGSGKTPIKYEDNVFFIPEIRKLYLTAFAIGDNEIRS